MDNSYKGIYKGFYKKRARKNERQALWTVEARTAIPPTLSRDPSGVRFALSPAGERGVKQPQAWTPPGYQDPKTRPERVFCFRKIFPLET